jgi:hypothetical protein
MVAAMYLDLVCWGTSPTAVSEYRNLADFHSRKIKYPQIFVCFTFNKHKNGVFWKNK